MNHVDHLIQNKQHLEARWTILKLIREFFWSQGFVEVETPLFLRLPGQEPYLTPLKATFHNERNESFAGFFHTSPEYTMKKMLAAGSEKIFSLGKVFRDNESFGGTHNPEFTMIEWYRAHENFFALMDDVENLWNFIATHLQNKKEKEFERLHMREVWKNYVGVNLDEYLEKEKMFSLCIERGYHPQPDEAFEDLFYRIFLNEIEPHLGKEKATIVHHYPKAMAALAKLSDTDSEYAERFEIYIDGIELANAFSELTDVSEQRARLEEEQKKRKELGKDVYELDEDFLAAVGKMPPSTGIALGIDRLVQLFTGCKNINTVLPLPASLLFEDKE